MGTFFISKIVNATKMLHNFLIFANFVTHGKPPNIGYIYYACTDELVALDKRWVLAEILHSHHTNMCTI